jgi:hypothetical protein
MRQLRSATSLALSLVGFVYAYQGVDRASLKTNVKWAIFHEGCRVYTIQNAGQDPSYQQMANIGWLRGCYMDVQSHNQRAQDEIRNANDDLLTAVTLEAAAEIPGEFQLDGSLQWVAYHEGQMTQFRTLNAQTNFEAIRNIYFDKQEHNPNAANLLSAVTNQYIRNWINTH